MLSKLDLMIMEELEEDARMPVQALAKKLAVARTTIRYRLNRLRAERIVSIACISDAELLGYQLPLLIGINTSPGKTNIVADQLMPLSAVKVVFLTVGHYDILVWAIFRDRASLTHFMSTELTGLCDIATIEMMHFYHWMRDSWRYFRPQTESVRKCPQCRLNDFDLSIVTAMQQHPRQTITQLAKTVGCSISAAKINLEKLINDGVIRFVSIVDPAALGYNTGAIILIMCKPDSAYDAANRLSVKDTARYVSLITGQWQIFFGAQFEDSKHMNHFLSDELSRISGIIRYEIVHIRNVLKYSFDFTSTPILSKH